MSVLLPLLQMGISLIYPLVQEQDLGHHVKFLQTTESSGIV